jgi:hypothetical protein
MTTMVISIENSANIGDIAAAVRRIKGVAKVKVQKEGDFEHILGLPYTYEERMADIYMAEKDYANGKSSTTEELKKRIAIW